MAPPLTAPSGRLQGRPEADSTRGRRRGGGRGHGEWALVGGAPPLTGTARPEPSFAEVEVAGPEEATAQSRATATRYVRIRIEDLLRVSYTSAAPDGSSWPGGVDPAPRLVAVAAVYRGRSPPPAREA